MAKIKSEFAAGASASLNRTITAIMKFLEDEGERPSQKLRAFLHEKIADSNERWFKKGFNRGHRESFARCKETGKVPTTLRYECDREVFTGHERALILQSKIKPAKSSKKRAKQLA